MNASSVVPWAGSSPRQKRNRSFAIQYLSLILIILTMILPLYGLKPHLVLQNTGPLGRDNRDSTSDIRPPKKKLVQAILPSVFVVGSTAFLEDKLEVLLTFLRSHPADIRLVLSGPVSSVPLMLTQAEVLEDALLRDSPHSAKLLVSVGISDQSHISAELLLPEEQ